MIPSCWANEFLVLEEIADGNCFADGTLCLAKVLFNGISEAFFLADIIRFCLSIADFGCNRFTDSFDTRWLIMSLLNLSNADIAWDGIIGPLVLNAVLGLNVLLDLLAFNNLDFSDTILMFKNNYIYLNHLFNISQAYVLF